jgi:hypothetical protein
MQINSANLFPFEYALMALEMKYEAGTATIAEADELSELVEQIFRTTYQTYYELFQVFILNQQPEIKEQLENLYLENEAVRTVIFDLHHLSGKIRNPNGISRVMSQLPLRYNIDPEHRNY